MALKRILAVTKNAEILSLIFKGLGENYEVLNTCITDEEGVVAMVSKKKPDLIILETATCGMEDLARALGIRRSVDVPIIILSISESCLVKIIDFRTHGLSENSLMQALKRRIEEVI